MPTAKLNGQQFFYEDSGGSGTPVVFSHGFLMDHSMWTPQVEAFSATHRVITWDWRGFGATVTDGEPFTVWDQAGDLFALLDHLSIDKAILVGMSHGGYITMRAALLQPERVLGIALLDTNAAGLSDEEKVGYKGMFDQWIENGPTDELTETFATIIIGEPHHNEVWKAKWKARPKDQMAQAAVATIEVEDLRARLGEITCPAVVIHGEDDAAFSTERAQWMADGIPGSGPVVVVPGGHAANLTHPEKVNEALSTFFTSI